jgi:hypothetical protein
MANKSEEYPMSLPNGEILGSFYSITGDYPSFQCTPGYEKIPDHWYKRNLVDCYTIPYLADDSLAMGLQVKSVPVNYAVRFSGPVTAPTARCIQNAVMGTLGRVPVQFTMRLRYLSFNS